MHKLIIADTSCLIVLQKIGRLTILKELFNHILVTPEVAHEFKDQLPEWIIIQQVQDEEKSRLLALELDQGEASAIALSLENVDVLLLIDERKGRRKASQLGIKIMGTLGVLVRAKEFHLIESLADEISKLKSAGFRMSAQLIQQVLDKYG